MIIVFLSLKEGHLLGDHLIQDNTKSKDVITYVVGLLVQVHVRGKVIGGSLQRSLLVDRRGEAKVNKFEIELGVEA